MTLRMTFERADLQRVRFAAHPDPMWEFVLCLHQVRRRRAPGRFVAWQQQVQRRMHDCGNAQAWLEPLFTLVPMRGGFPDFLTPMPLVSDPDVGLEQLRATSPERLRADLTAVFARRAAPAWVRRLADGERAQLDSVAVGAGKVQQLMLAEHWNEIRAVVAADRNERVQTLASDGLNAVLPAIPGVRGWDGHTLEVDYPTDRTVDLAGRGLTLLPGYFCIPHPVTFIDPELPPLLIYPAAAGAPLPAGADYGRLDALLSRTRAECLCALTTPRTTSALARAVGISVASASRQATVLRQAGLATSERDGGSVRHRITDLGIALLNGSNLGH